MTQLEAFQTSRIDARTASPLGAFNRGRSGFAQRDFAIMVFIDESSQYEENVGDFTRDLRNYDEALFGFVIPSVREVFLGVVHIESFGGGWLPIQPEGEDVFSPGGPGGSMISDQTLRPPTVGDMVRMFALLTPRFTDTNELRIALKVLIDVSGSLNPADIEPVVDEFRLLLFAQHGQRVEWQADAFGGERWLDAAKRILPGL